LKVAIDISSDNQIIHEREIESLTSSASVVKNLQTSTPRQICELKCAISSSILDGVAKIGTTASSDV
jgi:hypothetical protein